MNIEEIRKLMWGNNLMGYTFSNTYDNWDNKKEDFNFDFLQESDRKKSHEDGVCICEQLVAMEQGWDVGPIEETGKEPVYSVLNDAKVCRIGFFSRDISKTPTRCVIGGQVKLVYK